MISWKKLCEDSHNIAKKSGWLETPRSFAGDLDLMHSELSEALEEYRNHKGLNETYYEVKVETGGVSYSENVSTLKEGVHGKPAGIPVELADVIIRVCQYCGSNNVDLPGAMELVNVSSSGDFEEFIAESHSRFSRIWNLYITEEDKSWLSNAFAQAIQGVMLFCKIQKIDIETAIFKKQAYNKTREHRHGGKRI